MCGPQLRLRVPLDLRRRTAQLLIGRRRSGAYYLFSGAFVAKASICPRRSRGERALLRRHRRALARMALDLGLALPSAFRPRILCSLYFCQPPLFCHIFGRLRISSTTSSCRVLVACTIALLAVSREPHVLVYPSSRIAEARAAWMAQDVSSQATKPVKRSSSFDRFSFRSKPKETTLDTVRCRLGPLARG